MTIPNATVTIQDGRLGLTPELTTNVAAYIGVCSGGTVGEVNAFAGGNPQAIATALGTGPLVDAAAYANQQGVPVITCKSTTTTAGSNGSVTPGGSNTSTAVMTATGTPRDSYSVKIQITQAAGDPNDGTAAFKYSIDGGLTYSAEIALPTSGAFTPLGGTGVQGTGVGISFGSTGTLVVGDTFTFTATGPVANLTDVGVALTALLADARTWFMVNIVGIPADSAALIALFAAVDTAMEGAASNYRFARAMLSAYDGTDSALIATALSLSSKRVGTGARFGKLLSAFTGAQLRRPVGHWVTAARLGLVGPEVDAGQFDLGAVPGVVSIEIDEEATPGLDAARYSTLRRFKGVPGIFVTNARLQSDPTSDFRYFQHGRVMDIGATVIRYAGLRFLNKPIRVNKTTGKILEEDARSIENYCSAALRAETTEKGRASDATAQVDRTNNILSTSELKINYDIVPLAYGKTVSQTIGFKNPALVQVVA